MWHNALQELEMSTDHHSVWGGVPPRNPNFTGREELLEQLRRALENHKGTALLLSGAESALLANEFVHRHLDYDLVWWIPAQNVSAIRESLAALAPRLGLPAGIDPAAVVDIVTAGRLFPRWILVYEDVSELTDLGSLVPGTEDFRVQITAAAADFDAVRTVIRLPAIQDQLFVCYSHADDRYLEELRPFLKVLELTTSIRVWHDKQMRPGVDWFREIVREVTRTRVSLLLVSQRFLASDFIMNQEVRRLLEAARREGVVILIVHVSPSNVGRFPELSKFQAVNPPEQPLSRLTPHQRRELYVKLTDEIERAFRT